MMDEMQSILEVEQWKIAIQCEGRVVVLEETISTQDAAIEHKLQAGDVCVAVHQTSGRGRCGNSWNASGGVALTVVLDKVSPQRSIAIAAVLAEELDNCIENSVGIKWPNDLLVDGKKLAGILIEQREDIFLVGVGVNVAPLDQPNSISLHELGFEIDRASVANLVVSAIFSAEKIDSDTAIALWRARDILVGTTQTFISHNKRTTGTVLAIDPLNNLLLDTDSGHITLDASTAALESNPI